MNLRSRHRETATGYGAIARLMHWCVALAILATLALGLWMTRLPAETETEVANILRTYSLHKTLGVSACGLAVLRIAWTLFHPGPGPLYPERRLETFLAQVTHWSLWVGMVALPVTGFLHHSTAPGFAPILWPFGQTLPLVSPSEASASIFRTLHELAGWLLMAALALHVAGTAKHALVDRDATLARMVTGNGPLVPRRPGPRSAIAAAIILWLGLAATALLIAPEPEADPFSDLPEGLEPLD